ncbi:YlbL family protein [Kineococcus xinjiangensis]|nr:S16 family serine protease [Kineococcus xinjiangensis]
MDASGQRRGDLLAGSAMGLALLVATAALLPVPYVSLGPGSVHDTLGRKDGEPVLTITGRETHPTTGSLHLTTVSVAGGPGSELALPELLSAWVDPDVSLLRREQLYGRDETAEQADEQGAAEMTGSQEAAKVAALAELGIDVEEGLVVARAAPGTVEEGLRRGDVLLSAEGEPVSEVADLRGAVAGAGAGGELSLLVRRDGRETEVRAPVQEGPDGSPRLGVVLSPYVMPFEVEFALADVIGPSAGLMFALAVVDRLTPGAMTGGRQVAGTGSISPDGQVGVIGGLRQKLIGAREAGVEFFLAPAAECAEVAGVVPDGLRLVPVSTLGEARRAVEAIGRGEVDDLPRCPG